MLRMYHNRIADHYGIPHVSIKDTVYPDVESGKIVRADITPDNLHPNDKGQTSLQMKSASFLIP